VKVGDLVQNIMCVRTNPMTSGDPIDRGAIGIVINVRPDKWNNPPLDDYVDVLIAHDDEHIWLGNYSAGHFEIIDESR